jgi:hypothetical protein
MRCLSPTEARPIIGRLGFSISSEPSGHRSALRLDRIRAAGQKRIGARPPPDIGRIPGFIRAVNRWLPSNSQRLLWVDEWERGDYGHEHAVIAAARLGLGEPRSLEEAPGHLFDRRNWAEEDQLSIPAEMARALGLLTGLTSLLMMTGSDGWLISDESTDQIEFWEGNLFFHSRDRTQLGRADAIIDEFGCSRQIL